MAVSWIAFACISGGAAFGMLLRRKLPKAHLSEGTKDVVRLGTGVIGMMAALVLGLLVSSANSSYETRSTQVRRLTAKIILLDRLLEQYGPETHETRDLMRRAVITLVARIWRENTPNSETTTTFEESDTAVKFLETLLQLSPKNDVQRVLKDQALQVSLDISETRLLLFAQRDTTVPTPFLFVLVLWLAVIFVSFSLFASSNITIVGFLVVFALSAASAIYLIQELGQPFGGLMQISSAPLRDALPPLVQ